MKIGKAILVAASAAAVGTAVVVRKKKENMPEIVYKKGTAEKTWYTYDEIRELNKAKSFIKPDTSAERQSEVIMDRIKKAQTDIEKQKAEEQGSVSVAPIIKKLCEESPVAKEVAAPVAEDIIENVPQAIFEEETVEAVEEDIFAEFENSVIEEKYEEPASEEIIEEVAHTIVEEEAVEEAPAPEEEVVFEEIADMIIEEEPASEETVEETVQSIVEEETVEEAPAPEEEVVFEEIADMIIEEEPASEETVEETVQSIVEEEASEEENVPEITNEAPKPANDFIDDFYIPDLEEDSTEEEIAVSEPQKPLSERSAEDIINDITNKILSGKVNLDEKLSASGSSDIDFFNFDSFSSKSYQSEPEPRPEEKKVDVPSMEDLFGDLLIKTETKPSRFDEPKTITAAPIDPAKKNEYLAAQDIADNISTFAPLLEKMWNVKENKIKVKSNIIFDWEMRIESLGGDLPIKNYWRRHFNNYEIWSDEQYTEHAGEFISALESVGIARDNRKEITVTDETLKQYGAQNAFLSANLRMNEPAMVITPCWTKNDETILKGVIAQKEARAESTFKKESELEKMLKENKCEDGDVYIPVTADNFCSFDRSINYIKDAINEGKCKCAIRRMENGSALAFFYEVIGPGECDHYGECTARFEITLDKDGKLLGRFRGEKC